MERIIVLKANWLAEHGYQVTMLSMSSLVESFFPLSSKVKMEALDVFQGSVYDEKRNLWGALKSVYYSIRSRIDHKRKVEKYLESHSCDYFITLVNRGFIPKLKDGSKKYTFFKSGKNRISSVEFVFLQFGLRLGNVLSGTHL